MDKLVSIVPFDLHVHSSLSHDGEGTIEEYCELAVSQGMKAIGFAEHVDLDPRDMVSFQHDYEEYQHRIAEARQRYGDRLVVRMGAEIGYVPRIEKDIRDYLKERHYDYVIGSVHSVFNGEAGISEEYEALETFARHELSEVYNEYLSQVFNMVLSGLFDVVGHLDLVQRFGITRHPDPVEWGPYYGVLRRILEGAGKREMAVEINSSGLRQPPKDTYPCLEILSLYRELGGEYVIMGSDAHRPADLGAGIPRALKNAMDAGLSRFVLFRDRLPEVVDEAGPVSWRP
ncbi:MAG: histidinol-phosphatase [bacterium]